MNVGGARFIGLICSLLLLGWVLQPRTGAAASGTGDQAVAYQIDAAHDGNLQGDALAPPLVKQWSRNDLGGTVSYPLIAGGKVFVTVQAPYGSGSSPLKWIYALDENTGATVWSQPISGTYGFAAATYDNGTVYVLNYNGNLQSFDANTGTPGWAATLGSQNTYSFDAPPTASNGLVWVLGSGSGGYLFAVSEPTGAVVWQSPELNTGDQSSPTLSSSSVFVSVECYAYAFSTDPATFGQSLWTSKFCFSAGGGRTAVLGNQGLYIRHWSSGNDILDPATGVTTGTFASGPAPAFSPTEGFFLNSGTLYAKGPSGNVLWSFTGDGGLVTAPVVVNGDVYVGSSTGALYGLDAGTGGVVWTANVGAAFQAPDQNNENMQSGLGAGEGHLVAPAGSTLTAYVPGPADTTPPSISVNVKGPQGQNGWYTGPTTATWNVSDPESGIASSSGCTTTTLSTDTPGKTLTCTATNGSDLSNSQSVTLKLDVTAPSVTCSSLQAGWSATDVASQCTSSDGTSGLANAGDANFVLSTSVPAGTETTSASTPSRQVCDAAGNCRTAGPYTGLDVDKKAPTISLSSPVAGTYTLKQSVPASYSCTDGGSGVASCVGTAASGAPIDTASVGSKTFNVNAADNVGNTAGPASVSYSVTYGVCQSTIPQIKSGHSGTVSVTLCDASGSNVSSSATTVTAAGIYSSSTGTKVKSLTNDFSYSSRSGYTESVNTVGLPSGSYYVAFSATNDPVTHQAAFSVK